ncbi:sigma-70 family RNA polymerase sigma factor [Archangium violaceum]|nr:sigma-70 family RNA polymerase sigma factor [Archangium violaceum]
MLPSGSDQAVLRAFREGDRATLTRVYRAYSPEVVRYLARRFQVRSTAGVDSVTLGALDLDAAHQETFVRAFRPAMRQAYDGVRPYLGFLLTIARSTALDLLRASGRVAREAVPLDDIPELNQVPAGDSGPEERALESEVRTLVREFLDGLPEVTRELARLRFMEGLSQEVAAERLHLTRGEVRVRERHLRTRFTEYLRVRGWLDDSAPASSRATEGLLVAFIALCGMGSGI